MSYARTDLGKLYVVEVDGKPLSKIDVPVEKVVDDLSRRAFQEELPKIFDLFFEKNWPLIEPKLVEIVPEVVDSTLKAAQTKHSRMGKLVRDLFVPSTKKAAFWSAAAAVVGLTTYAIIRTRTKAKG